MRLKCIDSLDYLYRPTARLSNRLGRSAHARRTHMSPNPVPPEMASLVADDGWPNSRLQPTTLTTAAISDATNG